jgi:YD repeat-containing protein
MRHLSLACLALLSTCGATAAHATEVITYRYDARGRLVKVERSGSANNGVVTSYGHDKANNRTAKTTTGSPNPGPP